MLNQLSDRKLIHEDGDVPILTPVKNEFGLLPHFLRHYRKLGARNFIMVDNGSTDGSLQYLLEQDDCHVFQCLESYRDALYGMTWINQLALQYCMNRWCVFVDCDELLVYRNCEVVSLQEFCSTVGDRGFDSVAGAMIDMYPDGDFLNFSFSAEDDLLKVMGNFDIDYLFRPWPQRFWDSESQFHSLQVLGGPRLRLLSSLSTQARRGAMFYTLCNQVDRFIDRIPLSWIRAIAMVWPTEMPAQQKHPVNFIRPGFSFFNGHTNNNTAISDEFVSLLHFKLCEELRKRVEQETLMESHYRRGLSYEQLRRAVLRWGSRPLAYEGTRRFNTSHDLEAIGLIGPNVARLWTSQGIRQVVTSGRSLEKAA